MTRFTNPPQQRHPALQPLSRDHYAGLVQSQHLIKAADAGPAERRKALAAFVDAWQRDIRPHFEDEERLLAGLVADHQWQQLINEHRNLRTIRAEAGMRLRHIDPDADWMRHAGEALRDHIRWEERELFPAIQDTADAATLEALGVQTDRIETRRARPRLQPAGNTASGEARP